MDSWDTAQSMHLGLYPLELLTCPDMFSSTYAYAEGIKEM